MLSIAPISITLNTPGRFIPVYIILLLISACTPQEPTTRSETSSQAQATATATGNPGTLRYVHIDTSMGHLILQLDASKAPRTVDNFIQYVDDHFYDGTIFHRVIKDFMIQGGGFTSDLQKKMTRAPITNEADNGLKNLRGTIAMARTQDPHSATSQFFINHTDNAYLDHTSRSMRGWGYTVFGKVIAGMDVVDKISAVKTGPRGQFNRDVPMETILIKTVTETSAPQ